MTLPDCNMCLRELTEALPESADKLGEFSRLFNPEFHHATTIKTPNLELVVQRILHTKTLIVWGEI